jgi:hypothetical protein
MQNLFCRHCWKNTETWFGANADHIEARCAVCGGWIKFLSRQEIKTLLATLLGKIMAARPRIKKEQERGKKAGPERGAQADGEAARRRPSPPSPVVSFKRPGSNPPEKIKVLRRPRVPSTPRTNSSAT